MRFCLGFAMAVAAMGCVRASTPGPATPTCEYVVTPPASGVWTVQVEATIRHAASERLVDPEGGAALKNVALVEGSGSAKPLQQLGDAWLAPSCRDACTLRYELDLGALADACRRMDCARRVGDAVMGTAATWMLRPDPLADAAIRVRVVGPNVARFATGLRSDGAGGYALQGHELGEASYTAFGSMRRSRVEVPGGGPHAQLDVVLLGAPIAMGDAGALAWVKNAAACVAQLYRGFPAQATVFVLPVKGADEVVFGRVMSLAGGSVALLFGAETRPESEHTQWVVVHELSHLGTASFMGEAHWLEEGLATYYEPILRERAGWIGEADLWKHFVSQMPRGEPQPDEPPSLEERDDIDSTYWGGALFAMLADLRIRSATQGRKSLDDAMRAVHDRLGDATHSTTLRDFVQVADEATGTRAMADVVAHFATAGEPVDLARTWQDLGIVPQPDGSVQLRDDAPLAATRRAMATGNPH
jgi:hypothetical protein